MEFDEYSPASSNSTLPMAFGEDHLYSSPSLSFDFAATDDDKAASKHERIEDPVNNDDDTFTSTAESDSSFCWNSPSSEPEPGAIDAGAIQRVPTSTDGVTSWTIPHRGSLRRILSPSSDHGSQNYATPQTEAAYVIYVATEGASPHKSNRNTGASNISFDRPQYEFCTRLFTLLDAESQSLISPECIRDFVCLHCPVIRRRDAAMFALRCPGGSVREGSRSPTFEALWDEMICSDVSSQAADASAPAVPRIGIEGWMVFLKLLALAQHQESSRQFAARHSQQMMRHKHGGGSARAPPTPEEVVVVVDNPPPGPPSAISLRELVELEEERALRHGGFCPLPLLDLDLDHCLIPSFLNHHKSSEFHCYRRGQISIAPFTSSREGDFIVYLSNGSVVRRSYSDFEWLHAILTFHQRPGQGHLCGRIVPPFPSKQGSFQQRHAVQSRGASHQGNQQKALAAAKSGMEVLTSMAKSLWSDYAAGSTSFSTPRSPRTKNKATASATKQSDPTEEEHVPAMLAQRIERYLNYLLENEALSTSFVLNAIIFASQAGLAAAKQIMQEHIHRKQRRVSNSGALSTRTGPHLAASLLGLLSNTAPAAVCLQDDHIPWLQSAARVALALQVHGILETTGHNSTSARLQLHSLPRFYNHPGGSWEDEETNDEAGEGASTIPQQSGTPGFEAGVINVESELAVEEDPGDYELLPLPGPSEEHRALSAIISRDQASQPSGARFTYGASESSDDERTDSVLGSLRVEKDIEKVGDILRPLQHTLQTLHQWSTVIHSSCRAKNEHLLSLLRDIDAWGESGGLSQRALVDGVAALDIFSNAIDKSNSTVMEDMLWQSTLASSAVATVKEVRDAVRAACTASRAKSAAFAAAEKAKKIYEACDRTSPKDKIQQTQTEAATAKSHAIHATVVEYEAHSAKKRSAVSLVQDIKAWNMHRRRELLHTCVQLAKSQREACRTAADAWADLIDASIFPSALTNSAPLTVTPYITTQEFPTQDSLTASEASKLAFPRQHCATQSLEKNSSLQDWDSSASSYLAEEFSDCVAGALTALTPASPSNIQESIDMCSPADSQCSAPDTPGSSGQMYCLAPANVAHLDEDYFSFHQGVVAGGYLDGDVSEGGFASSTCESVHSEDPHHRDAMSTSMQSLIDGLMAWGGEDEGAHGKGTLKHSAKQ